MRRRRRQGPRAAIYPDDDQQPDEGSLALSFAAVQSLSAHGASNGTWQVSCFRMSDSNSYSLRRVTIAAFFGRQRRTRVRPQVSPSAEPIYGEKNSNEKSLATRARASESLDDLCL